MKKEWHDGLQKELTNIYQDMNANLKQEVDSVKAKWSQDLKQMSTSKNKPWPYILTFLGLLGGMIIVFYKYRRTHRRNKNET